MVDGEILASWDLSEEISSQNVKALLGPDIVLQNFPKVAYGMFSKNNQTQLHISSDYQHSSFVVKLILSRS